VATNLGVSVPTLYRWIPDEMLMGNPDSSSLIDLGSSFTVIRRMGIVPIDKQTLVTLVIAAAVPMVAVVIYATPTDALIHAVLNMLGLTHD
jgi:hypothetical protein